MSEPSADGLKLNYIRGGLVTHPAGTTYGPRRLRDFEIVWVIQGETVYHAMDRDVDCPPGGIAMGWPGLEQFFTWDPQTPTRHAYLHFDTDALPADWPAPEQWPLVRQMPDDDVIRPLLRYVLSWCRQVGGRRHVALSTAAQRAMATLLDAYITGTVRQTFEHEPDYPEPVQRAWRFVRETLDDDPTASLTLGSLASAAAVSSEHLCRLFAQTVGVGPMEMVRLSRLDRAMVLLVRSNLTIQQIADRCGFASPYHFSRRFKAAYGRPPSEVRRRAAQGHPPPTSPLLRRTI